LPCRDVHAVSNRTDSIARRGLCSYANSLRSRIHQNTRRLFSRYSRRMFQLRRRALQATRPPERLQVPNRARNAKNWHKESDAPPTDGRRIQRRLDRQSDFTPDSTSKSVCAHLGLNGGLPSPRRASSLCAIFIEPAHHVELRPHPVGRLSPGTVKLSVESQHRRRNTLVL
jgi:hypothetical protein